MQNYRVNLLVGIETLKDARAEQRSIKQSSHLISRRQELAGTGLATHYV